VIFNFYLRNHSDLGQITLGDPCDILMGQLRALGHRAQRSDKILSDVDGTGIINVVFEGFTPSSVEGLAEAHRWGSRFMIIATERPAEGGFNGINWNEFKQRQDIFPEAARYAEAIWALIPGTEEWYGRHAPTACVELGYAPGLVGRVPGSPDCEFAFHGNITQRRKDIFRRLARRFTGDRAGAITAFAEPARRDETISRGKVVVQVRAYEEMGSVSSSRCCTALHLGRPVVAEPHELSRPWDEVIHFSKSLDAFYDDVVVKRIAWRSEWERQFERFKTRFSPERCVGQAIRQTFGFRAIAA
jgi:hypothetical protein